MAYGSISELRENVTQLLLKQGFEFKEDGRIFLKDSSRESRRKAHQLAKAERLSLRSEFLRRFAHIVGSMIPDGNVLDIEKISPMLIEVRPNSAEEEFYRWWNLAWWSLPYEHAYGRQMRFIVWDDYHHAIIGLIGLQSPILKWAVRDDFLGIPSDKCDFWVNQSMNAQRLGAIPPYNEILGGKLVALLMTCDRIRQVFYLKYHGIPTIMQERELPARLLFVTTTGAYGKSSIYERLRFGDRKVAQFIGYTEGAGSFHISDALYEDLLVYLAKKKIGTKRGYGSGPSRKLRLIDTALGHLGFRNGAEHGISRGVYIFPFVENLQEVIQQNRRPRWYHRDEQNVTEYWKNRWALPRSERNNSYLKFRAVDFMHDFETNIDTICSEKATK